ncbi:MAG TPA: hypothetical protein VNA15_04090 [Candidatus Angelobacter sp.]|nr:hypothetical protein [Candidatus Angelobacter sp.]
MRTSVVLVGFGIILFGLVLWIAIGFPIELTGIIGIFNIILGIITPRSTGLEIQPEQMGSVKLVVDQARSKSGIYELFFTDSKLVMKKLASTGAITAVALLFFLLGGIAGGLTGYSLQEFMAQRGRDKIRRENSTMTVSAKDREIPYDNMSQLEWTRRGLKIVSGTGVMYIAVSKKHRQMIASRLRDLIPSRCWAGSAAPVSM